MLENNNIIFVTKILFLQSISCIVYLVSTVLMVSLLNIQVAGSKSDEHPRDVFAPIFTQSVTILRTKKKVSKVGQETIKIA